MLSAKVSNKSCSQWAVQVQPIAGNIENIYYGLYNVQPIVVNNWTMTERHININDFDYPLPDERIAKFPLEHRDSSKLLVYRNGNITERHFSDIGEELSPETLFVFNNTKVVRARLVMHKPSGYQKDPSLRVRVPEKGR